MLSPEWKTQFQAFLNTTPEQIMAICAYGEARSEGAKGIQAVINVIQNRVRCGGWFTDKHILAASSPTHGTILKKWQFSCFLPKDLNFPILKSIAETFDVSLGKKPILQLCYDIANMDNLADLTRGATHYYERHIPAPNWVADMTQTIQIGNHIFFK